MAAAVPMTLTACSVQMDGLRADSWKARAEVPVNSGPSIAPDGALKASAESVPAERGRGGCPSGMVDIDGRFCIDRYEASLVEVLPAGGERGFSPYSTIGRRTVRAVSMANVFPQGYISAVEAESACASSGKRLCRIDEWSKACRGPEARPWGYGEQREPGRCNDNGKNPVRSLFGMRYDARTMNEPSLNQVEGTLARTGEHAGCTNGYGVFDMVGNLHEWVADPDGTFKGGYYQDVQSPGHGDGCSYVTKAHEARYHDYSTGFRCCADTPGRVVDSDAASSPTKPRPTRRSKKR